MGISDPYVAYCLDEVCFIWGTYVESEIRESTHKPSKEEKRAHGKAQMTMKRLLDEPGAPVEIPKGKFRDPAASFRGKAEKTS